MNGVDICSQRARQFKATDFEEYDMIYAMAADVIDDMRQIAGRHFDKSKVDLLLNEVYPGKNLDVPDPWYGPEPGYHEVYRMIEEACEGIVKKGQRDRGTKAQSEQP
jgi:protein-tyrosine phosphatase